MNKLFSAFIPRDSKRFLFFLFFFILCISNVTLCCLYGFQAILNHKYQICFVFFVATLPLFVFFSLKFSRNLLPYKTVKSTGRGCINFVTFFLTVSFFSNILSAFAVYLIDLVTQQKMGTCHSFLSILLILCFQFFGSLFFFRFLLRGRGND